MVDAGYDISSFGVQLPELIDVSNFNTIADFLEYPTGQSMPTFCSGSGMHAET